MNCARHFGCVCAGKPSILFKVEKSPFQDKCFGGTEMPMNRRLGTGIDLEQEGEAARSLIDVEQLEVSARHYPRRPRNRRGVDEFLARSLLGEQWPFPFRIQCGIHMSLLNCFAFCISASKLTRREPI
ncbi:hypothetical protein Y600_5902 [Burkholderia pseudomallei MSHR3709]|nr:hypothetical protein Y600_5902 [Burkholderia pseudomallei MSHR3709]